MTAPAENYPPHHAEVRIQRSFRFKGKVYLQNKNCDVWGVRAQIWYLLQSIVVQLSEYIIKKDTVKEALETHCFGKARVCSEMCCETRGILTFLLNVVVWKTKCCRAPAICCGSGPCGKKKEGKIKGKVYPTHCSFQLLQSYIWVCAANIITYKFGVLLCLKTVNSESGSKKNSL